MYYEDWLQFSCYVFSCQRTSICGNVSSYKQINLKSLGAGVFPGIRCWLYEDYEFLTNYLMVQWIKQFGVSSFTRSTSASYGVHILREKLHFSKQVDWQPLLLHQHLGAGLLNNNSNSKPRI